MGRLARVPDEADFNSDIEVSRTRLQDQHQHQPHPKTRVNILKVSEKSLFISTIDGERWSTAQSSLLWLED